METTHRKTCNSTMCLVSLHTVVAFYELDDFRESLLKLTIHHGRMEWLVETHAALSRSCLERYMSIWHDYNHRLTQSLSCQVINNLTSSSIIHPFILITTCTMKQVKHRVFLIRILLIFSRCINIQPTIHIEMITLVPDALQSTMWNLLNTEKISQSITHDEVIAHCTEVTENIWMIRVHCYRAIYHKHIAI